MSESIERENKSEKYAVAISSISNEPNLKGDWKNFFLLLLLYTMQGLPLGLISSIPVLLKSNKNVSYNDQVKLHGASSLSAVSYEFIGLNSHFRR
jgi:hypothetical protein